jgi:hypothetical protein
MTHGDNLYSAGGALDSNPAMWNIVAQKKAAVQAALIGVTGNVWGIAPKQRKQRKQ